MAKTNKGKLIIYQNVQCVRVKKKNRIYKKQKACGLT